MNNILCLWFIAVVFNKTYAVPIQSIANGNPYLLSNLGINNLVPIGSQSALSPTNYLANYGSAVFEPIASTNILANTVLPNEVVGSVAVIPNTIAKAIPNNLANLEVTNVQFTPVAPEIMSSVQFGDVSVTGDLPIGGTIKVCGCIPVYGMINVDGIVPTAGNAVVAGSIGNQISDIVTKCANQFFS